MILLTLALLELSYPISASGALETAALSETSVALNLNFDDFDGTINLFNTSLDRKLQSDLNDNTKFFEVLEILLNFNLVHELYQY